MSRNIPVLLWSQATFTGGRACTVICDSAVDTLYTIGMNGTDATGELVKAQFVIIDNTGNNSTVFAQYGIFRYGVAPYTRKTFPILKEQNYLTIVVSLNTVPVTFTDFDPGLPDDVNQVATGAASGGGGGMGSPTAYNPLDKDADLALSGSNLTAQSSGGPFGQYNLARTVAFQSTGKYYAENLFTSYGSNQNAFGIANATKNISTYLGIDNNGIGLWVNTITYGGVNVISWGSPINPGGTGAIAFDLTARLFWGRQLGGPWNNDALADPENGIGGVNIAAIVGAVAACICIDAQGGNNTSDFGASPFLGTVPVGFTAGFTA